MYFINQKSQGDSLVALERQQSIINIGLHTGSALTWPDYLRWNNVRLDLKNNFKFIPVYIYSEFHTGEQTFCSILCQVLGYKFFCLIDWINCPKRQARWENAILNKAHGQRSRICPISLAGWPPISVFYVRTTLIFFSVCD